MLQRHPLAFVGGLILLVVLLPAGSVYWDYASHFESTDDAFIAARQFTIAPKVPGYLTAIPVTDNEHVVAGQVIARIDDRDYRNALAEARAQVAAARANIENIDAQIVVQQAQIRANQAQVDQGRPSATRSWRRRLSRALFRMPSGTPRGCVSNRLQWRVRKEPSRWRGGKSRR